MKRAGAILCLFFLSGSSAIAQAPTQSNSPLAGIPVPIPPGTSGVPEAVLSIPGVSGSGLDSPVEQRMPKGVPVSSTPPQIVEPTRPSIPSPPPVETTVRPPVSAPNVVEGCEFWGTKCGYRFWGSADYLLWWMDKGPQTAPLVTTGSPSAPIRGALGQPGTTVLFGGSGLNYQQFSGLRVTVGAWLDRDARFGIELGGFGLLQNTQGFSGFGDGDRILGRPFTNAVTGLQNLFAVSAPDLAGNLNITSKSQLWSAEASGLYHLYQGAFLDVALLGGVRTLDLTESLQFDQIERNLTAAGGLSFGGHLVDPSSSVAIQDSFGTENRFYGGQMGLKFRLQKDIFFVDVTTKVALGVNREQVAIDGNTTLTTPTGIAVDRGGFLASGSNIGTYSRDSFAVIPEGNIQFGAQIKPWLVVKLGYNFLWWNSVVRPGNQIDQTVNLNHVPSSSAFGGTDNTNRPSFGFQTSAFWVQGMTVGLEVRY